MLVVQNHYVLQDPVGPDFGNFRPQVQGQYSQITGGRGGSIYKVTSLDGVGSGAGTIRGAQGLSNVTIVFECAGYIDIPSPRLNFTGSNVTIAGQTAPNPGIHFRYTGSAETYFLLSGNNIICQHFSVRGQFPPCNLGIELDGDDIILDHISLCWQQDEGFIPFRSPLHQLFWRCLVGEALHFAPGSEVCSGGGIDAGHGIFIYSGSRDITVAQCVIASTSYRCPMVAGQTDGRILNNIIYNMQTPFLFQNQINGVPGNLSTDRWEYSAVGNRIIRGPVSGYSGNIFWIQNDYGEAAGANKLYKSDNTYGSSPHGTGALEANELSYNPNVGSPPAVADLTNYTLLQSSELEDLLIPRVGARPKFRHATDTRITNDIVNRTAPKPSDPTTYVRAITEVGGFPSISSVTGVPWTDASSPNVVVGPHGRTNRDLLLESQALTVEI